MKYRVILVLLSPQPELRNSASVRYKRSIYFFILPAHPPLNFRRNLQLSDKAETRTVTFDPVNCRELVSQPKAAAVSSSSVAKIESIRRHRFCHVIYGLIVVDDDDDDVHDVDTQGLS